MLIIIEHSGSKEHVSDAKEIQDLLEDEFGCTVEQSIADSNANIVLYTESLRPFAEFPSKPDDDYIRFFISSVYEDD